MSHVSDGYLKKRLLRVKVGFLLSEGPGNSREIPITLAQRIQVDDDLFLDAITGSLILTRTKEGILVQGTLQVAHERECDRCLDAFIHGFRLDVAELFTSPPDATKSVFSVDSNGEINLAPLLREEVIIEESYRAVCRDDCHGLSAALGHNLNHENESREADDLELEHTITIDPRLAVLQQLLK